MDGFTVAAYGDAIAEDYDSSWRGLDGDTHDAVNYIVEQYAGSSICDVGAGTGRLTIPLARAGFDVHAIDCSSAMLHRLESKIDESIPGNISTEVLDIVSNPVADQYDVFILNYNTFAMLGSLHDQESALQNMAKSMKKNSHLIIQNFIVPESLLETVRPQYLTIKTISASRVLLSCTMIDKETQMLNCQDVSLTENGIQLVPYTMVYRSLVEQDDCVYRTTKLRLAKRFKTWDATPLDELPRTAISIYSRV